MQFPTIARKYISFPSSYVTCFLPGSKRKMGWMKDGLVERVKRFVTDDFFLCLSRRLFRNEPLRGCRGWTSRLHLSLIP